MCSGFEPGYSSGLWTTAANLSLPCFSGVPLPALDDARTCHGLAVQVRHQDMRCPGLGNIGFNGQLVHVVKGTAWLIRLSTFRLLRW